MAQSEHSRSVFRNNLRGEDAYSRHVRYITQFQNVYGGGSAGKQVKRTEMDGLVEKHKFLRDDDDKELNELSPDDRIAVKYYRGLFKEFALVDLKHYKSGQFALRWRTEPEVLSGLGQFTCGNTRCAYHQAENDRPVRQPKLVTLELPFGYVEEGEAKQALVKVVLCERCKKKLMWKRNKEREEAEGPEEEDQAQQASSSQRGDSSKREREREREKAQEPSGRDRDRRDRERKQRHERSRSRSPRRTR